MPDRRWNLADLEAVARAHTLTDGELAQRFPRRQTAEIRRLRAALHLFHESSPRISPSDNFAARLELLKGQLVCALCGQGF